MKILALDTSSTSGSIALLSGGELVSEFDVSDAGPHARWLLKSISELLAGSGVPLGDIGLFAFTHGPGSFTGLRIGASVVKGLAWSTGRPVAGVSTLEAMAMNIRGADALVCPVLDARRGEVYWGLYSVDGAGAATVVADRASPPDGFVADVRSAATGRQVVFMGPGLPVYGDVIREAFPDARLAPEDLWRVRAMNVAIIAAKSPGSAVAPGLSAPLYLRRSAAEAKLGEGR